MYAHAVEDLDVHLREVFHREPQAKDRV